MLSPSFPQATWEAGLLKCISSDFRKNELRPYLSLIKTDLIDYLPKLQRTGNIPHFLAEFPRGATLGSHSSPFQQGGWGVGSGSQV